MSNVVNVGISDMKIARLPDTLVTFALGSCVGICLYDPMAKIGGLAHIMLPNCMPGMQQNSVMKFADTCLPFMLEQMLHTGCSKARLTAKIAGGAKMFSVAGDSNFGNIGERNVLAVKGVLQKLGLRLLAEDTGQDYGRTVYFYTETGSMEVRSFSRGNKTY